MPRMGDMFPSRFLKESDLRTPLLLTIKKIIQEPIGSGKETQEKWVVYFLESTKCLTLNKTNAQRLEKISGSDNADEWIGKQVVVYWDDEIEYMGEITGGVRIRAPKKKEDDLPF